MWLADSPALTGVIASSEIRHHGMFCYNISFGVHQVGEVICPYVMKLPEPVVFYIHGTKANPKFMGVNPSAGNIAFRLIETCGHYTALSNISVHPHSGLHWRSFISKRSHRSRISFQHSYPFRICRSRFIAVRNPSCSNLHRLSFIRLV